ncbi:MAG: sarcosine oxidase subunit alpha, partial [Thermoproteota archaeon]
IVGAGNVGLILAYQLLQAGARVEAVVEIMPRIGGYFVHAAKIRRLGVPILLRHTIVRALGRERVEGAEIAQVDESWKPIEGTERVLDVDMVVLAVGLSPSCELPAQAGAEIVYVPELGGNVPLHGETLRTTVEGMWVAGDASGIEEATTAMLEGRIAGADAASELGYRPDRADSIVREALEELEAFRSGPFSERVLRGKKILWREYREVVR